MPSLHCKDNHYAIRFVSGCTEDPELIESQQRFGSLCSFGGLVHTELYCVYFGGQNRSQKLVKSVKTSLRYESLFLPQSKRKSNCVTCSMTISGKFFVTTSLYPTWLLSCKCDFISHMWLYFSLLLYGCVWKLSVCAERYLPIQILDKLLRQHNGLMICNKKKRNSCW